MPSKWNRVSSGLVWAVALGAWLAIPSYPLLAQTVTGRIAGTISDPGGNAIPQAQVVLTAIDTKVQRSTISESAGTYAVESVLPGRYSLEVRKEGFKAYVIPELVLQVNESRTVDVRLELGVVTQHVEVQATTLAVDTTTATLSGVIENEAIIDLPLNGRNFTQLDLLTPGAAPVQSGQQGVFMITGGTIPAVNGMRAQMNNFTLDGSDNNMRFTNGYATAPPPDAIQEFSVESHQTSPEASFAAGGTVNLVTKSGTNDFHGSAWEFLRNEILDANGFFNNLYGAQKLPRKQNQYGFFLGGPLTLPHILDGRKSRTFFAGYFEGYKVRETNVTQATVPDAEQRQGNFSESLGAVSGTDCIGQPIQAGAIYDPLTTVANAACPGGYARTLFTGNQIPAARIQSIAGAYVNDLYPLPNTSGFPNFTLSQRTKQDNWQWGARVDHTFSEKDSLFGRFSQYNAQLLTPGALPVNPLQQINSGVNAPVHETHIFNPTFLVDLMFAYNRATIPYRNLVPGAAFDAQIGSQMGEKTALGFMPAGQTYAGSSINPISFLDYELANPDYSYQANADFKKIHGKHDMTFGFRFLRARHFTQLQGQAALSYSPDTTNLPGVTSTGNAFSSFLLGLPTSSSQNLFPELGLDTEIYIGYWGDVWKLTPKLTMSLGLQYVYNSPPLADGNRISDFDWGTALTQPNATDFTYAYIWAGKNPITGAAPNAQRPSLINPDRNNFAPRFSLAYSPTAKTVVRTGFGVYYDYNQNIEQSSIRVLEPDYPYSIGRSISNQNQLIIPATPTISLANPFLPASSVATPSWAMDLNNRDPYVMEWNFGIQRLLPANMKVSVDYVGSGSRKLDIYTYENVAQLGPGTIASRQPLPNGGPFSYGQTMANSSYNGLQVKFERPFTNGLTFTNAFTYSKALDLSSQTEAPEYTYNRRLSWGPAQFNIPLMNVSSFVYQVPIGKGRRFASGASGIADQFIGGWELSSIITLRSGEDYTVLSGIDNANIGGTGEYAEIVSPAVPSGFKQSRTAWFNPSAFQTPAFGTLGNVSRDAFRGPDFQNVDFAAMKYFQLGEKLKLQFRSEFFNVLNQTQFGNPYATVSVGTPLFGQILSAYPAREIQFALKLLW